MSPAFLRRTNVIDDQSDYFEVDTNHWLTDRERAEMKQRRQLEEQAEAEKKKRLTVTIDLMGRKVSPSHSIRQNIMSEWIFLNCQFFTCFRLQVVMPTTSSSSTQFVTDRDPVFGDDVMSGVTMTGFHHLHV